MTASELTELAARVEAGQGEDRELDADVASALSWITRAPPGGELSGFPPRWTSSLDAVVALIAERLPGWFTHVIQRAFDNTWSVELSHPADEECSVQSAFCTTEVRARLSCCLRALAAQQQDRPTEGDAHD